MRLVLQRRPSDDRATQGELFVNGRFECYTLEDVVREDPNPDTPENEAKMPGATAIPAGLYRVTAERSPKFGLDTLTINDVPGFQYIRIHGGNKPEDTEGCILVGDSLGHDTIYGAQNHQVLAKLKAKVLTAIGDGEDVTIEIRDAP